MTTTKEKRNWRKLNLDRETEIKPRLQSRRNESKLEELKAVDQDNQVKKSEKSGLDVRRIRKKPKGQYSIL